MMYTITVHLRAKYSSESTINKLKNKLIEASRVYSKDKETVSWFVMQSVHDPRDFTIVERYEKESSQKYHLENPYWKTFDLYVKPLLAGEMDLRRFEELDTQQGCRCGVEKRRNGQHLNLLWVLRSQFHLRPQGQ